MESCRALVQMFPKNIFPKNILMQNIYLRRNILMSISALAGLVYLYIYLGCIRPKGYWKRKGVRYEKPWCFIGNLKPFMKKETSLTECIQDIYNRHPSRRYVGYYQFCVPTLLIRDPDLIKLVFNDEFRVFPEHRSFVVRSVDPLWSNNLFVMKGGPLWQALRNSLSPKFTNRELNSMHPLIIECTNDLIEYLNVLPNLAMIDMKDLFGRVTNDMIAYVVFGTKLNSLVNRNNEFYVMGREAADLTETRGKSFLLASISPVLAWILGIRFFSKTFTRYFTQLVATEKARRQNEGIRRQDMFQTLMDIQAQNIFPDNIIAAQAVEFLVAGYDTVSTTMSYAAYELAVNPQIQHNLIQEIDNARNNNSSVDLEIIKHMKYMDMVVSEVLRKWPPFGVTERKPVCPYTFRAANNEETDFTLTGDVQTLISIYGVHRDAQYYSDPETFNPERFTAENKSARHDYVYLPFGAGRRKCLGNRFALMEVKTVLFYLLTNYEIISCSKTDNPLVLSRATVNPFPENGIWLGLKRREIPGTSH